MLCSAEGWRVQRQRYGGDYPALFREVEARGAVSREAALAFRDARLATFVRHAARTVPFWRRRFRDLGLDPGAIRGLADLARLPLLTKAEVQAEPDAFLSEAIPAGARVPQHTSGTTGAGLRFATTHAAVQEQWAVWWRYRRWHGLEPGTWAGTFAGRSVVPLATARPPYWRYNTPGRQVLFSGYHLSAATAGAYADEVRRRGLPWLHGYPSLLALFAAQLLARGERLTGQIRWVTIGAENLLPQQAALMQEAFGVAPRQHYGLAEAAANASECRQGVLHVDEDFAAVEFVPDAGGYQVVGTNLSNLAMPLLRYVVGDTVEDVAEGCACGLPGRVVRRIDGRLEDYVVLPSGAKVGRLDHAFKDMTEVHEAQVVQEVVGAVRVRLVPGQGWGEAARRKLLAELAMRLGGDTGVEIEEVAALERSRTGKLRFVVSRLGTGSLHQPGAGAAAHNE